MAIELDLGPKAREFRDELREWLEANLPEELVGVDAERAIYGDIPGVTDWLEKLSKAGYICVTWPEEFGGRGLSGLEVVVMNEEFARLGVPRVTRGMGEWLVGPSIIVWGTDEQKAHFLPRIIDGTDRYCQGFSEPDAGSDLASLKTRGVVDGDEVVITGQKVWTSGAQSANMMFCLCRTDPDQPKHRGISYVLTPMSREDGTSNGFELRPIKQLTGSAHFTETFITEARAPLFNVIGGLNNGWRVTMTTLGNERGGNATTQHVQYTRQFWAAVELARELGVADDPLVRQQLAWAYSHCEIMRFQGLRLLSEVIAKKEPGPASALNKMFWSEYAQRFADEITSWRGMASTVLPTPDAPAEELDGIDSDGTGEYPLDRWQQAFLASRSVTIWGGTRKCRETSSPSAFSACRRSPVPEQAPPVAAPPDATASGPAPAAAAEPTTAPAAPSPAATGMLVAMHAAADPSRVAIVAGDTSLTFGAFNARANQLVRGLRARGLKAGDGLVIMCSNRAEFAEVYTASQRSGLRLTTVNWHLTADEAAYIIIDCEARAVIADAQFGPVASGAVAQCRDDVLRIVVTGGAGKPGQASTIDGFEDYESVLAGEDPSDLTDPVMGATMLYTSGTTGRPKGVFRKERAATSPAVLGLFGAQAGDVHLCTGPLYHAAPLAFSLGIPLALGATVVVMDGWDAEETLQLIERHSVTHTHMVPTMFHRLLSLPEQTRSAYDLSSLRFVIHGAAPCPVHVKQRLIEWLGPIVYEYYAATEGTATWISSAEWLKRPGTVGRVTPPDLVRIIGPEGDELPAGEAGLVYIKAPDTGRFEYFKDADKTASTYSGQYFSVGDVGYVDADGYLYLSDRSANLIISGGVNIYPAEVDAVLLQHPAVGDAATIGVPDEEWGETVIAVVEPAVGVEPSDELAAELVAFCRANLAHFKCPRQVDFIEQLPRQDNGKIYKRLLRDRYREGTMSS